MMKRIGLVCAVLLVPALAWAQPKTPGEFFKEGENQYNLGDFDKAVEAFKAGFAMETDDSKKSVYLFNIAQAYRQKKDCTNAQFFYKRFLSLKDADTVKPLSAKKRTEIEDLIKGLDDCAKQQETLKNKPPDQIKNDEPDKQPDTHVDPNKRVGAVGDSGPEDGGIHKGVTVKKQKLVARLTAGVAKITTGNLTVPLQATVAVVAGYPLPINPKLTVDVGIAFTDTPISFENMVTHAGNTAQMIGTLANVGATYAVAPKISLRGDVGLGMMFFAGASESPWTNGSPTSGALAMFHVRAAAAVDYLLAPNLVATFSPAFSFSPPKSGLRSDIKSITAIDIMVGLGYRM
jgi:tetratricopeptide (TPR) repeat protein